MPEVPTETIAKEAEKEKCSGYAKKLTKSEYAL
jgi:hypothetical protein